MSGAGIKQVAALAGVSVGTVSNVLNRPDRVGEQTRARVNAAIAELGFVRNESARHLRAGRSRTLAYVVLDAGNPFFTDVARGVEEAARAAGLALFLCNSADDAGREDDYIDLLTEQRVHGILITPVDASNPRLQSLAARSIPVVLVDHNPQPDQFCSVTVDDVEGGVLAVTHLVEQGHERIAVVGDPRTQQVVDRVNGAQKVVQGKGSELVVLETTGLNVSEGRRAAERLAGLPAARRPTAVFCTNDLLALGFLQQLTLLGVRVPDDVALVGYDDIEFAGAAAVPLTSVRQPRHALGRTAADLLLAEAEAGPDHVHRQVQFAPELVVRASSTAPRR